MSEDTPTTFGTLYTPSPGFETGGLPPELPIPRPMSEQVLPVGEYANLQALRDAVHAYQYAEVYHRLHTSPAPTAGELAMGAFAEQIEPQVRQAVLGLWDKGYYTNSSGFMGDGRQIIEGHFDDLPATAVSELAAIGVTATPRSLSFSPAAPNLAEIKNLWDRAAEVIPGSQSPQPPMPRTTSGEFSPGAYFQTWLNYGLGLPERPALIAEISQRNPGPSLPGDPAAF